MNAWQELVKMSLLGTEKAPLQTTAALPPSIAALMEAETGADPEARFLKAAALTLAYRRAGSLPPQTPLPSLGTAPAEALAFAPAPYSTTLKRLFEQTSHKYPPLFFLLFERMKNKGYVLPHQGVYGVLCLLESNDFKRKKALINEVVGERGRWLWPLNPAWGSAEGKGEATVLAEGSAAERRAALYLMREREPSRYFEYVQAHWAKENARERKDLMSILSDKPQAGEWPFVQSVYEELLDEKLSAKAINLEIKELAVLLLLRNPASDLFQSTVQRLSQYVGIKKTMLGLQSKTVLELPNEPDGFLNAQVMRSVFAHTATPSTNELLTEYWFTYFLENLHPTAWEAIFQTQDWAFIFNTLDETDRQIGGKKKQQRLAFHWHLSSAIGKAMYRPAGLVYLNKYPIQERHENILQVLGREELEAFCLKKVDMGHPGSLRNVLIQEGWRWSPVLSRHVLDGLMNNAGNAYVNVQFGVNIAMHFHDAILPELQRLADKPAGNEWHEQHLKNSLVLPLIEFLELRAEIERL